ncbi:MAG: alkaline phosphatase [Gemmatimonadetes bacterium]|nr:alkaline phosphatase [Gemmatimonadota bacterium]
MRSRALGLVGLVLVACGPFGRGPDSATPRPMGPPRVVLFIGDGAGLAYWSAARFRDEPLAVEEFRVVGLVDTRSASHKVTDSAAGATVYATGVRTYNGAIGVGPDSLPRRTVLELAEMSGLATGLVATSSITHATPASFTAHVSSRQAEPEIARQMAGAEIDVLLGGGRGYFDGSLRPDSQDLLTGMRRRYSYVEDAAALRTLRADTVRALLGLFAPRHLPAAAERRPTLAEMTSAALAVLDHDPEGFFLMVEGSQPDWRGHENNTLESVTAEMLDLDRAVRAALVYREKHPETLIVVVADHETGGLALEEDSPGTLRADYTTEGHTGEMVPLFAIGPGAERFGGILPNTRVGELLLEAARRPGQVAQLTLERQ